MKINISNFIIFLIFLLLLSFNVFAQFQPGTSMVQARMAHYQVLLDNGNLWLVGGHGTGFKALNTSEIFDINAGQFALQDMNYFHDSGALVKMNDGKFLIAGGAQDLGIAPGYNTAEIYNPTNNTYTITGPMKYSRTNCYGAVLKSGKVLISGGWYDNNSLTYSEIYDPNTGTFISSPALVVPRANPMVFPTNDGGAIVFGGYEGYSANPYYQSVEYYDALIDSFKIISNTILPNEEGYYISALKKITDAFKTKGNNYVFVAYRKTDTVKEYVFLSFDPESKTFSSLYREPVIESDPITLIGSVLSKNENILYTLWQLSTTPIKIGLSFLDLNAKEMSMPSQWYELPENYYLGYVGLSMLNNNTIMMSGGFSSPGGSTNFSPIDSTLMVTLTTTDIRTHQTLSNNYVLSQNYPNPFNPTTVIKYQIPSNKNQTNSGSQNSSIVILKVYDILGNEVATLVNEEKHPGDYEVQFDGSNLSSGIYYYKFTADNFVKVKQMVLLK